MGFFININNGHSPMSLINQRRRSARWHGASQKVGQSAALFSQTE